MIYCGKLLRCQKFSLTQRRWLLQEALDPVMNDETIVSNLLTKLVSHRGSQLNYQVDGYCAAL